MKKCSVLIKKEGKEKGGKKGELKEGREGEKRAGMRKGEGEEGGRVAHQGLKQKEGRRWRIMRMRSCRAGLTHTRCWGFRWCVCVHLWPGCRVVLSETRLPSPELADYPTGGSSLLSLPKEVPCGFCRPYISRALFSGSSAETGFRESWRSG